MLSQKEQRSRFRRAQILGGRTLGRYTAEAISGSSMSSFFEYLTSVSQSPLSFFAFLTLVSAFVYTYRLNKDSARVQAGLEARRSKLEAELGSPQDQLTSPKLAWDLARVTLEQYFNRNLDQTRQMFIISLAVMMAGFGLVVWSTIYSTLHALSPSLHWIGAASGVITQFIGATFMVMYRSNTQQSSDYVKILERINAVGMAVQLLDGISDKDHLLSKTKADMAKLLLSGSMSQRSPRDPKVTAENTAKPKPKRKAPTADEQ